MEPREGQPSTDIVEEPPVTPTKPKVTSRPWLLGGLGAVLLMVALAALYLAVRPPRKRLPGPTAEDLEQQKYDTEQRRGEDTKAGQLRTDPTLAHKETK